MSYLPDDIFDEKSWIPEDFENISNKFISFLESDKTKSKNAFIIWHLAGKGWGKTAYTFIEINYLLKNPNRCVQFWRTPNSLIERIQDRCPQEYIGRFECIDKLRDLKYNSVFVIDEGLLGANGKEALKREMRGLIKTLSTSRHRNNIIIINSVSLGILLELKSQIDIVVYKHLSKSFIRENKYRNEFLSEFENKIIKLKEPEGFIESSYKRFDLKDTCKLNLNLKEHCSWYHDSISRYQREASADITYDDDLKTRKTNIKLARKIVHEKGRKFKRKDGFDIFESWLYNTYPDIYIDNKSELRLIYKLYKYYCEFEEEIIPPEDPIEYSFKEKESFQEFCRRIIVQIKDKEFTEKEMEKISKVAFGLARGDSYRTIDDNNPDIEYHFIRKTSNWLRNEANTKYGLGYLFEKWFAYNLEVPEEEIEKLGGNNHGPDLDYNNEIWTFKFRLSNREKSYKFRQSLDFTPEFNLAKKRGSTYKLGFMDPKWDLKVQIIKIDPFLDPEEIIVKKPSKPMKRLKI